MTKSKRVAILVPSLACGGTERVVINLLKGLVKHNLELELVIGRAAGEFLNDIPIGVKVINLQTDAGFNIRDKTTIKTIYCRYAICAPKSPMWSCLIGIPLMYSLQ